MTEDRELIVQVTPEGEVVGPIDREEAHRLYILHAVVMVFLFTPADESRAVESGWFQVRSPQKKQFPGYLSPAAAGHITYEPDIPLEQLARQTAANELAEEIGLTADLQLLAVGFLADVDEQQYMFVFSGRTNEVPTRFQASEVAGVKKLTLEDILALGAINKITPFTLEALRLIGLLPEKGAENPDQEE